MAFITSLIVTVISMVIALSGNKLTDQRLLRLCIQIFAVLVALISGISALMRLLVFIPAGSVGVEDFQGKVAERVREPGIHVMNPFADVVQFSTRLRDIKETIPSNSKEGLSLEIDISLQYRLDPSKAPLVYQNLGTDEREFVVSRFRSTARQLIATYPAESVYGTQREKISQQLREQLTQQLAPLGFVADEALLRNVKVPDTLQAAIQQRLKSEQESIQMQFVLEREKQEAERKRIEARGRADAQKILADGLTPAVLQLRTIEATEKLSQSPNSKLVIIGGSGQTPAMPLILPADRGAVPNP
ncbi:MAG: prohibitin family protein [Pseudanabaena sp. ELA607]